MNYRVCSKRIIWPQNTYL